MTSESGKPFRVQGLMGAMELPASPGQRFALRFDAAPGLYQFSVILDARGFDWEQLYENLSKYGNSGQRTGPWDFSNNHGATPVVPSYWVSVNGRRIGLWFMRRVSLEDLAAKRFRGRMAFYAAGPTTLELEPYQPGGAPLLPSLEDVCHQWYSKTAARKKEPPPPRPPYRWEGLAWLFAALEPDPEDVLEPLPPGLRDGGLSPAARWAEPAAWERLTREMAGRLAVYAEPVRRAAAWEMAREAHGPDDIVPLVAAARLGLAPEAMSRAVAAVDRLIGAPAWGNPNPEAYAHNGDMGAMSALRGLAWAWRAMPEELGPERRARVLERLRRQGDLFFDLMLLNRDYWGGSVMQDHGWRSAFGFAAVALSLLGAAPEAERWLRLLLPRTRRSLAAMPRDGAAPAGTHKVLYNYMHEVAQFRDALLAATGEDIYDQPQFAPIVDYFAVLAAPAGRGAPPTQAMSHMVGANQFLNQMAAKLRSGEAAAMEQWLLAPEERDFLVVSHEGRFYAGLIEGLMSRDPEGPAPAAPKPPPLSWFRDSGRVVFRDDRSAFALSIECGPGSGYHADARETGPCDRMGGAPISGDFRIAIDHAPLLGSAPGGYKLNTALGSCLLVDGAGQYGDVGYPMSIPSWRDRGDRIAAARWDEAAQEGFVRLELHPAYGDEQGVLLYTRDFLLTPGRVVVRDTLALDRPRTLSWLFQGTRTCGVALDGLAARFGRGPALRLAPESGGLALAAAVRETPVVWSYNGPGQPRCHVRYDALAPAQTAQVDFVVTWG